MIALDLDGTLLRSDHTVSDETVAYLQKLHQQGMKVIIATGRAAPTTYPTVRRLNLPYQDGTPVVCSNGAKGMLCQPISTDDSEESPSSVPVKTTQLFVTPVPKDITARVIQLAKELQYVTQYYWDEEIFANPFHESHFELTEMYIELTGSKTIYVKDDFANVVQTEESRPSCWCCVRKDSLMIFSLGLSMSLVRLQPSCTDRQAIFSRYSTRMYVKEMVLNACVSI